MAHSDPLVGDTAVKKHAEEFAYTFPVLLDPNFRCQNRLKFPPTALIDFNASLSRVDKHRTCSSAAASSAPAIRALYIMRWWGSTRLVAGANWRRQTVVQATLASAERASALAEFLFGWAPGAVPQPVELGISRRLPKDTDIVVQIHYHPWGKVERDQSQLGLRFSGSPIKGVGTMLMLNTNIYIPAGAMNRWIKASMTLSRDGEVFAIAPHAHYLAKEMKIDALLPDGTIKHLIYIKDWDFNWQGQYRYKEPVHLPVGTRIELAYSYDNSTANPQNPSDPPKAVRWGEQTTDEMAIAFLGILLPTAADVVPFEQSVQRQQLESIFTNLQSFDDLPSEIPPATVPRLKLAMALVDRDNNGKLDEEERAALMRLIDVAQQR